MHVARLLHTKLQGQWRQRHGISPPLFGHVETKNGNEIANIKNPKNDFRHHTFWQRMVPGDVNGGWVKPNYS